MRISTVDDEGWPRASLLSAGDMLALASGHIRFVIFPDSVTTTNLVRDGRMTLTVSMDGAMWELRLRAHRLADSPDIPLACFEAEPDTSRFHSVPYASLTSGITFELKEQRPVLERWERQIAALREAA